MKYSAVAAALAAAALTLTACGTPTAPTAAPSSSSAASSASGLFREQSREGMRRLEHNASLGIPGPVISQLAEAAAQDQMPLAFSWGTGCSWIRTPDGTLWSLHTGGGALTGDDRQRAWFQANPGALVDKECEQRTEPLPTRPDPAITAPYRWRDGSMTKVSVGGTAYALPAQISPRGEVLTAEDSAGPTSPTN